MKKLMTDKINFHRRLNIMNFYRQWPFIILIMLLTPSFAYANNVVSLNVTPKSYPPFFISNEKEDTGIFFEIIETVVEHQGSHLKAMRIPRKRGNAWVEQGDLNAVVRAVEWVPEAHKFSFSDPILQFKSVLVSLRTRSLEFTKVADLAGSKLLTQLGFKYPKLSPYFATQAIERIDVDSQYKMLQMILKGRGDGAVINEKVALWLIKKHQLQGLFYISKASFGSFDIRVMFNKKNGEFVKAFNQSFKQVQEQGRIESVLEKYQ